MPSGRFELSEYLAEILRRRGSVRVYGEGGLPKEVAAKCLWAAQGATPGHRRTVPSAGGRYPLTVYLVAGDVVGIPPGAYRYHPEGHRLDETVAGDIRAPLSEAALGQACVREAPAALVIAGAYARTTEKYGPRGHRYVHMEAGHAAQNVYLQAAALGVGAVLVGAFGDDKLRALVGMGTDETPLALLPVGPSAPRDSNGI